MYTFNVEKNGYKIQVIQKDTPECTHSGHIRYRQSSCALCTKIGSTRKKF